MQYLLPKYLPSADLDGRWERNEGWQKKRRAELGNKKKGKTRGRGKRTAVLIRATQQYDTCDG